MKIPMTDLTAGYELIRNDIEAAIKKVVDKANFILGEEVSLFEKQFAKYCGTSYAIGVANGTDALRIALIAASVTKGDEVITTPSTFIATTEAIVQAGATPVFVDINPKDYTINPDLITRKITKLTKAILPVHLYGHPANMEVIKAISNQFNLKVIEDCAQSFSAKYKFRNTDFNATGSIGHAGCFSFFPAKNLGCFGDGGMITTNDKLIYENATMLRNHGSKIRYSSEIDGYNSRLDTLQAAILSVKLKHIDTWTQMRNNAARKYNELLGDIVTVPETASNCQHSFNYYTILFETKELRNKAQTAMLEHGISCQVYYPISLHLQKVYEPLGYKKGDFPVSETLQDRALSLPMYPEISDEQIKYTTDVIRNIFKK